MRTNTTITRERPEMRGLLWITTTLLLGSMLSGCGYNTMVSQREEIDAQWAQVENQLQRRNDLIPNLVEVTKGYASHEKEIFSSIAEARSKLMGAGSRGEKIEAANAMSGALGRLLAVAENYPNLKADTQFARLSDELAGTENRISTERRRYNDTVKTFNTTVKQFPTTLFAGCFGFSPAEYFEVPPEAKVVPKVEF